MLGTLKKCKIIQLLLRIFHILLETKDRENIFLLYWVYFPDYPYFIAGLLGRERSSRTHPIQLSVCRSSFYRMARIEVNSDLSGFTKGTVVATSGTRLRFWRPLKQPEGNPNTGMPETNDLEMTGLRFPHGPRESPLPPCLIWNTRFCFFSSSFKHRAWVASKTDAH